MFAVEGDEKWCSTDTVGEKSRMKLVKSMLTVCVLRRAPVAGVCRRHYE